MKKLFNGIAITIAVGLCIVSTFISQGSANEAKKSADQVQAMAVCNQKIMKETLTALNARSTYAKAATDANIDLQTSLSEFFGILLHQPPYPEAHRTRSAFAYFRDLQHFLEISRKNKARAATNPFPTLKEYKTCISEKR